MHSMTDHEFLLVWEVAEILRIGPKAVRRKIREGLIKGKISGKAYLVAKSDLQAYIDRCPWRNPNRKGAQ